MRFLLKTLDQIDFRPSSSLSMRLVKWANRLLGFVHSRLYCSIGDRQRDPQRFYPDDIDAEPRDQRNFEPCCLYTQLAPCNPCKSIEINKFRFCRKWSEFSEFIRAILYLYKSKVFGLEISSKTRTQRILFESNLYQMNKDSVTLKILLMI